MKQQLINATILFDFDGSVGSDYVRQSKVNYPVDKHSAPAYVSLSVHW